LQGVLVSNICLKVEGDYPCNTRQINQQSRRSRHIKQNWKGLAHIQFTKDAAKLAQEGWRVQSQTATGQAPFGQGAKSITVVYVR
jgi:hypothetical protein